MCKEDKIVRFRGRKHFAEYWEAIKDVEGGTISPGGVAQILRMTRQGAFYLLKHRKFRAWEYYEEYNKLPSYVEVSVLDVVRYAIEAGTITQASDISLVPDKEWYFTMAKEGSILSSSKAEEAYTS
jgi:hypothetical protein